MVQPIGGPTTAPFPASNIASLDSRVALITGASSGIGRMIAQAYAAAGAYVVCADITPNPPKAPMLEKTAAKQRGTDLTTPTVELLCGKWPIAENEAEGGRKRAVYVECDVTREESVEAAVRVAVERYGRLDVMVNNAGE